MKFDRTTPVYILLPDQANRREEFAAGELYSYLKKIFDCKISMLDASDAEELSGNSDANCIAIGSPLRNSFSKGILSKTAWKELELEAEGFAIQVNSAGMMIAGAEGFDDDGRGVIYAVYEMLERGFGCALTAYTKKGVPGGEYVPSLDAKVIESGLRMKKGADLPYRCAIVQYNNWAGNPHHELNIEFIDWLVKNRYNRILTWTSVYDEYVKMGMTEKLLDRGIRMSVGHHESSRTWLPYYGNDMFPEHYRETHPEYYRLNADGSRYTPKDAEDMEGQWIYCSRNMEAVEAVANNLVTWIRKNPVVDTIAFWPNDSMSEPCHCEKCSKYTKAENYAFFENEVAKIIGKECPGVNIDMLVYQDLWKFPEDMELSPNLIIDESTWAADGLRYVGAADGSGLMKNEFERNLLEWHKSGATAVFYDYFMGIFGNRQRIIPMASELHAMWNRFKEAGIAGSGTQLECFHIWNHLLNLSGFARVGYDAKLELGNLIALNARLFGKAADIISEIFLLMEKTLNGQVRCNLGGIYLIENIDTRRVYEMFDEALALAETPAARNNVKLFRMAFRYSDLEVNDPAQKMRRRLQSIMEYEDPTGELRFMANTFDSYQPDPAVGHGSGYGINMPVKRGETAFKGNLWYELEE